MRESMRILRFASTACLVVTLIACADLQRQADAGRTVGSADSQRYRDVTLDSVVAFAAEYARGDAASRLAECHRQAQSYAQNRQLSGLLRMFVAQLGTEACGDLATTARVVRATRGLIADARLSEYLSFQLMLADSKRSAADERARLARRLDYTRYNLKKAMSSSRQAMSSSKQALSKQREALSEREQALSQTREIYRQMLTRDAEARQLKEKLDALKSIEQDVNDTER